MKDWVELAKLTFRPRYSFSLWVVCLLILLFKLPEQLRVQEIQDEYGSYVGVAGLLFFVVWFVELIIFCSQKVFEYLQKVKDSRELKTTIEGLNPKEKVILAKHLEKGHTTLNWSQDKQEIASLVHKGILQKIESSSSFGVPHTVDLTAWRYLQKNKISFLADASGSNPSLAEDPTI